MIDDFLFDDDLNIIPNNSTEEHFYNPFIEIVEIKEENKRLKKENKRLNEVIRSLLKEGY